MMRSCGAASVVAAFNTGLIVITGSFVMWLLILLVVALLSLARVSSDTETT